MSKSSYGFVKVVTWIYYICQSCYMYLSKLIYGFVQVVTLLWESCYIDLSKLLHIFPNQTKLKFSRAFEASWRFLPCHWTKVTMVVAPLGFFSWPRKKTFGFGLDITFMCGNSALQNSSFSQIFARLCDCESDVWAIELKYSIKSKVWVLCAFGNVLHVNPSLFSFGGQEFYFSCLLAFPYMRRLRVHLLKFLLHT